MRLSRGFLRTYTAGLALAVALVGAPAKLQAAETSAATSAALSNIHIDNFGEINERYFRGAQPKGDDFHALSALGVKLMIDLAEEGDRAEEANAKAAGINFVRIPMSTHEAPSADVIAKFLALVNDPANQPVYVHCIGGRHRTGVMTAIYRMTMDGWNSAKALAEMKQYKFGQDFLHPEFKQFVSTYVATPVAAAAIAVK
jgi:protein tyrosine/serine phosphatase